VAETWNVVFTLSGGVWYVPVQVLPLQLGAGSCVGLLLPTVIKDQVLPLFGPPYVKVTGCPAGTVVGDAVSVTGTTVNVADTVGELVDPLLAIALNFVVLVRPLVLYEYAVALKGRVWFS